MDCLICFKIFIKETEFENISLPKSDICANSICKLLEIPNSPRIQDIFKDPLICSKCYQTLEDVNHKFVQLEELQRKIDEIRGEVVKDLKNSKNVSQVMQNAYGGEMTKSSLNREQLFEVVEGISNSNPQDTFIAKNDSYEPQESIFIEPSPQPEISPMRITRNRGKHSNISAKLEIEEFQGSSNLKESRSQIEMNLEKRITPKSGLKIRKIRKEIAPKSNKNSQNSGKICKKEIFPRKSFIPNPEKSKKDLICSECEKPHNSKVKFEAHLESALKSSKVQKCSKCPEEFWGNQCLKYHLAKHHKELDGNYKRTIKMECGICLKKFPSKASLKRHEFCHSEQKPFHCQYCSKGFIDKSSLIRHLGDEKPESCGLCREDFKSNGCLRYHNFISHELSYHAKFKSTERRHLVECKKCSKYFSSKHIKDHELTHGEQKFKCPEIGCEKLFKRKFYVTEHFNIVHRGIRYKCKVDGCGKKFIRKFYLKYHAKTVHKNI